MSNEWSRLQDLHLSSLPARPKQATGDSWTTSILFSTWTEFHTLWLTRNKLVHGHDAATREAAQRTRVRTELEHLYSLKSQMRFKDQVTLHPNFETHMTGT